MELFDSYDFDVSDSLERDQAAYERSVRGTGEEPLTLNYQTLRSVIDGIVEIASIAAREGYPTKLYFDETMGVLSVAVKVLTVNEYERFAAEILDIQMGMLMGNLQDVLTQQRTIA